MDLLGILKAYETLKFVGLALLVSDLGFSRNNKEPDCVKEFIDGPAVLVRKASSACDIDRQVRFTKDETQRPRVYSSDESKRQDDISMCKESVAQTVSIENHLLKQTWRVLGYPRFF